MVLREIQVASFWDEDAAWHWINEQIERPRSTDWSSIDTQVTKLENGSYRASVSLIQAQGELFE